MTWLSGHLAQVGQLLATHAALAGIPLVIGLILALPIGWAARRFPKVYPVVVTISGLLFTIPSLALFILMPLILGTQILDPMNVVIALSIYTVALLVRTVADGLASVPEEVVASATAMGIPPAKRFFTVDLPLAVPVITSGLRVAAVSNVSIASVAALIGIDQLGTLFTDGFARSYIDPIVVGLVACILLAAAFDLVIAGLGKLLTPWRRAVRA